MANHSSGPANPNWKGGRTISSHGYVLIRVGKDHPLANVSGYAYEHRLKLLEMLGRVPSSEELAHHEDEVKHNNVAGNIRLVTRAEHILMHKPRRGRSKPVCGRGHTRPAGGKCRVCENELARARYVSRPRDPTKDKENGRTVGAITAALQKAKTHCPQGHLYDQANTRIYGNRRVCKACCRDREAQRRNRGKQIIAVGI